MPPHIGIVGCSAEGAALCYRTICLEGEAWLGPGRHPEVTLHTPPLEDYTRLIEQGHWQGVGELMIASGRKLAQAGADFLICPDNTIHQAFRFVELRSTLPWLHIADVVAEDAVRRRFRRLGLLGTKWLMESDVYPEKLRDRGLAWVLPTAGERDAIHRIIMEQLVRGVLTTAATDFFGAVIERMKGQGCDAVVLGCTEIPLVVNEESSPLQVLDSTRLLARAALRKAAGGGVAVTSDAVLE
jgi:aspartate racemase